MGLYTKHEKKKILKIRLHGFSLQNISITREIFPVPRGRLNSQSENLFNPFQLSFKNQPLENFPPTSPRASNPLARKRNRRKAQYGCEPLTSKVSATAGCPSPAGNRARPRSLSMARAIIVIAIYCSPRHRNKQY